MPVFSEEDRKRQRPQAVRLQLLKRILQLHIPTKEALLITLSLRRSLNFGYVSRNPIDINHLQKILTERGLEVNENILRYFRGFNAPIYGFSVNGISGVGKTTPVENILSFYPQIIEHYEYLGTKLETKQ